jgi:alkylation response protein AidB-like acyl-CoA dehydrogenase
MNFDFTEEQTQLKDSVAGLLAKNYTFDKRKTYMATEKGYSLDMWQAYAEQGLLGLPFSEEDGGFGMGAAEMQIVMEQMGRALTLEPYFATVILAGGLLKYGASDKQKEQYLPSLIDGSATWCFAFIEKQSRNDFTNVKTSAVKSGDVWHITGDKCVVLSGDFADMIIVTTDKGLFIVNANAQGVSRRGYNTQDGLRGAEISFNKVEAVHMDGGIDVIERVRDEAIAYLAAESTGCFDVMVASTVDYMKQRKQFGVVISQFQALQHKASEMYVSSELARSMSYFGASMLDENAAERSRALSQVKVQIGRSVKFIGQGAIQLHGGVGMTNEYAISHYFKRVTTIDTLFGDADEHLEKVAG